MKKLPIYQLLLRVTLANSRRDAYNVFADRNTDSRSDSDPWDDEDLDMR